MPLNVSVFPSVTGLGSVGGLAFDRAWQGRHHIQPVSCICTPLVSCAYGGRYVAGGGFRSSAGNTLSCLGSFSAINLTGLSVLRGSLLV